MLLPTRRTLTTFMDQVYTWISPRITFRHRRSRASARGVALFEGRSPTGPVRQRAPPHPSTVEMGVVARPARCEHAHRARRAVAIRRRNGRGRAPDGVMPPTGKAFPSRQSVGSRRDLDVLALGLRKRPVELVQGAPGRSGTETTKPPSSADSAARREPRQLVRVLQRQGWTHVRTRGSHLVLGHPDEARHGSRPPRRPEATARGRHPEGRRDQPRGVRPVALI